MYYEARGEGVDGQKAVAEVVLQRTRNRNYGNTVCSVVYEGIEPGRLDCQFSFACDGSRDRAKEAVIWQETKLLAEKIMTGQAKLAGLTGQAVAYHSVDVTPFWSSSMYRTAQIGNHVFYRFAPRNGATTTAVSAPPPQNVRSKVQNISTDGAQPAAAGLPKL
jgi:spore germination cell wall hydrolase CwlJ-like protein